MKKTIIKFEYDIEKYTAMEYYLLSKNLSFEEEIEKN